MKIITSFIFATLFASNAFSYNQQDFSIPSDCLLKIQEKVIEIVGNGDEGLTIESVKLIYGGVFKGSSFPVVALVSTSDEVDPRDVLVKTSAPQNGLCTVEIVEILADGLTINF